MKLPNKKNILLLGGGYEQLPAILESKKFDFKVFCVDKNNNCIGRKFSDKFYNISIKDKKKLNQIIKKNNISGVSSVCSEVAVPIVSYLSKKFNFPSISLLQSKILTDKHLMKNFFKKNNIMSPKFEIFKNIRLAKKFIDQVNFPIIIKPSDSFGQRGIFKINNYHHFKKKIIEARKNSHSKSVILEKFIEGPEINVVAIIHNKKLIFLSFSDRVVYKQNGFGIAYEHLYPSKIEKRNILIIKSIVNKIVKVLNLNNVVIYPQFLINKKKNHF